MHTEFMLGIAKDQAAERYAAAERWRLLHEARRTRRERERASRPIRIRRHPVRGLLAIAVGHPIVRR
jgi:hypothetical protein